MSKKSRVPREDGEVGPIDWDEVMQVCRGYSYMHERPDFDWSTSEVLEMLKAIEKETREEEQNKLVEFKELVEKRIKSIDNEVPMPMSPEEWKPFADNSKRLLHWIMEMVP